MLMSGVMLNNDFVPKRNDQGEIYSPFMRSGESYPELNDQSAIDQHTNEANLKALQDLMKQYVEDKPDVNEANQELTDDERREILLNQIDPMRAKYLPNQE